MEAPHELVDVALWNEDGDRDEEDERDNNLGPVASDDVLDLEWHGDTHASLYGDKSRDDAGYPGDKHVTLLLLFKIICQMSF